MSQNQKRWGIDLGLVAIFVLVIGFAYQMKVIKDNTIKAMGSAPIITTSTLVKVEAPAEPLVIVAPIVKPVAKVIHPAEKGLNEVSFSLNGGSELIPPKKEEVAAK